MSRTITGPLLRLVVASLLFAAAGTLAGCGAPHAGRSAGVGPCAQVLPLASATVHRHGRLILAEVLSGSRLRPLLAAAPRPSATAIGRRAHQPKTCLIVYRDSYRSGEIAAARASAGRYAILLIRVRHPLLIVALVRERLPPAATR